MIDIDVLLGDVQEGREYPLMAWGKLKSLESELKKAIEVLFPLALEDSKKYESKTFEDHSFKFEYREGGKSYIYDHIPEWAEKKKELKEIEDRCRAALQAYDKGLSSVDNDSGEFVDLPKVTYRKASITAKPV